MQTKGKWRRKKKTLRENETDTFISVDTELCRVAINCSVYGYRQWKGRGGREIHFPISIVVRFFKLPLHKCLMLKIPPVCAAANEIKITRFALAFCRKMTKSVQCTRKKDAANGVTIESQQFRIRCPPLSLLALILTPILFPLKRHHSPHHPFPSLIANP